MYVSKGLHWGAMTLAAGHQQLEIGGRDLAEAADVRIAAVAVAAIAMVDVDGNHWG